MVVPLKEYPRRVHERSTPARCLPRASCCQETRTSLQEGAICPTGMPRVGTFSCFVSSLGKYFSSLHKSTVHARRGLVSTSFNNRQTKVCRMLINISPPFLDYLLCSQCPGTRGRETTYTNSQNFRYK